MSRPRADGALGARLALPLQISRYRIDHRGIHTPTQADRTGGFPASAELLQPGLAARPPEKGRFDGPAVALVGVVPITSRSRSADAETPAALLCDAKIGVVAGKTTPAHVD